MLSCPWRKSQQDKQSVQGQTPLPPTLQTTETSSAIFESHTSDEFKYEEPKDSTKIEEVKCIYCEESHSIYSCQKLATTSMEEKQRFIRDHKLCFACLRRGHISKDCRKKATCGKCKKSHPTPLHEDRPPVEKPPSQKAQETEENACKVNGGDNGST